MATIKISQLTAAAAATGTQELEVNESGTSKKITGAQLATYIEGEVSSSPSFTGQVSLPDGTNTAPSLTNTGDTNTGIYFPAEDEVGIATGGTLRVSVNSGGSLVTTGNIELGHATDTTISRSSAGVIAVEGGIVPKENRANTFTANQVIEVTDNTNAALRITQLGTGAAIRVEDSANPDSTPFIVDANGNVGIGTASPAFKLDVNSDINVADGQSLRWGGGSSVRIAAANAADVLGFYTSNTERMRIDGSGNVGIGTSSPSALLHVSAASAKIRIGLDAGTEYTDIYRNSAGGYTIYNAAQAAPFRGHIWQLGGTEAMRIDSSGNVGIGTDTPSSFDAKLAVFNSNLALTSTTNKLYLYYVSSTNHAHVSTATDGSITFTTGTTSPAERMRINNSGNIGIGTTSPDSKFQISGTSGSSQFRAGTDTNGYFEVNAFDNNPVYCVVGGTNATSGIFGTQSNIPTIFFTNNTERMRIDGSGYAFINETATQGTASWLTITAAASSVYGATIKDSGTTYASTTRYMNFVNSTNAVAGSIQHTAATTTAFSTSSDARLKENIIDAPSAIDIVSKIPVRSYDWKEDGLHVQFGFVAQELEQIYTEPVGVGGDDVNSNPWSIEYGRLTPLLVKALQELKADFDAYKSTHP